MAEKNRAEGSGIPDKFKNHYAFFPAAGLILLAFSRLLFVVFEQASFDSDQAVMGLMAKHLAEGSAFPVFFYGQRFMLGVEAWLAAPLFWLFSPGVFALKLPLLLINAAAFLLLMRILKKECGLAAFEAWLASLFFVLPSTLVAARLTDANGGNVEPFLWILLLWVWRERPALLGLAGAVGILNREFAFYGFFWIIVFRFLEGKRDLKFHALAFSTFAAIWVGIRFLAQFSDNYFGPGSSFFMLLSSPAAVPGNAAYFFKDILPHVFGLKEIPLTQLKIASRLSVNPSHLNLAAAAALVLIILLAARAAWKGKNGYRHRRKTALPVPVFPVPVFPKSPPKNGVASPRFSPRSALRTSHFSPFPAYLMLVGATSCVSYIIFGEYLRGVIYTRYVLPAALFPVGAAALFFRLNRGGAARRAMVALILLVAAVNLFGAARLWREYLFSPPPNEYRDLTNYLLENDVRYAVGDYWTAYRVSFLSGERVMVFNNWYIRIKTYKDAFRVHAMDAWKIQRAPCAGGAKIHRWNVCPPKPPRARRTRRKN